MVKRFYLILITLFVGCSAYYKYDEAYDKRDFLKAYEIIENIKNKNNINYKTRYYKILIRLALEGDKDFIIKLSNLILIDENRELSYYKNFGKAYILYLSSKNLTDYSNTLIFLNSIKNEIPLEFKEYFYKIKGITSYKALDYESAIEDLKISYKNPSPDTLYFIGMSYFNQKKYKEARSYFDKMLSSTLNEFFTGLAYFQIGEIYYENGNYNEALKYYLKAQEFYPDIPEFAFKTAKSFAKMGYNALSEKFLKIAMRVDKNYATAWFYLNIQ